MATPKPHDPSLNKTDEFILNRGGITYKTPYSDLLGNLIFSIQGGDVDNGTIIDGNGKIAINDLSDASTVKKRTGTGTDPVSDINAGNIYWTLQYVPGEGEFVLSDPKDFLNQALELDNLLDVTTRDNGGNSIVNGGVPTAFNTIIMMTDATAKSEKYEQVNLSDAINDLIDPGEGAGNLIEIELDNILDVNPGAPDPTDPTGRLEITSGYKPGGSIKKYDWKSGDAKLDDDILVYIKDPAAMIKTPGSLTAGWYYAAADFGDTLEKAGSSSGDDDADQKAGTIITLGGVRVTQFRDTKLTEDAAGDATIAAAGDVGSIPTNISITSDGVLYSSIPNTLTFVETIDIVGAAGTEQFSNGDAVSTEGPGNSVSPKDWANDPASLPETGDFYVIRFVESSPSAGDELDAKTLKWNDYYPPGSTPPSANDGPDLPVRDGDMVAFGNGQWAVIGTVDTGTVAQDLQSVTTRGETTDVGIKLVSADLSSADTLSNIQLGPAGVGNGQLNTLSVGSIDFTRFPTLPTTP